MAGRSPCRPGPHPGENSGGTIVHDSETTMRLRGRHKTIYRCREPVAVGPHGLMLRPRESPFLRLGLHCLEISPVASVVWAHDVASNAVATANFDKKSEVLVVESLADVVAEVDEWPIFDVAASAVTYPFLLNDDEMMDLGAFRLQAYLDTRGQVYEWARSFIDGERMDTLTLLKEMNRSIASEIVYEARESDGSQTPVETLFLRRGACRDFAVLFVDAVRSLGFAGRIVSGYLYDPDQNAVGSAGGGTTHAWAEVYVPGAGWIVFDPTNRSVGGHNLIPVAVGRHIRQVMPVSGSFAGKLEAFEGMEVSVSVEHTGP